MAKKTSTELVRVKMTGEFTYKLDGSSKRTLPKGWAGAVPTSIAELIEKDGAGAREADGEAVTAPAKTATKKAAATKSGAASQAATGTTVANAESTSAIAASSATTGVVTGAGAAGTGAAD
ncbi:hypothetical protein [Salipiger mangrovisoli]|uniref:Uncharacterized protein n=1 Tax=Salipiger mangrovisoli TaxID=2865933 RepID=A0ABR9WWX3_9RHOB|nr:hypothetical protein [Salipiger mangrovisoli]MBE9635775.1 hypothetical protein [Salipiger mangrovisoli]